jgi:hypothetical protein
MSEQVVDEVVRAGPLTRRDYAAARDALYRDLRPRLGGLDQEPRRTS